MGRRAAGQPSCLTGAHTTACSGNSGHTEGGESDTDKSGTDGGGAPSGLPPMHAHTLRDQVPDVRYEV